MLCLKKRILCFIIFKRVHVIRDAMKYPYFCKHFACVCRVRCIVRDKTHPYTRTSVMLHIFTVEVTEIAWRSPARLSLLFCGIFSQLTHPKGLLEILIFEIWRVSFQTVVKGRSILLFLSPMCYIIGDEGILRCAVDLGVFLTLWAPKFYDPYSCSIQTRRDWINWIKLRKDLILRRVAQKLKKKFSMLLIY